MGGRKKSKKGRGGKPAKLKDGGRAMDGQGVPTPESIQRQMESLAREMGLACDGPVGRQGKRGHAADQRRKATKRHPDSPKEESTDDSIEPRKKPRAVSTVADLGNSSQRAKLTKHSSRLPAGLRLRTGDGNAGLDPNNSAWDHVGCLLRLTAAARTSLGHPPSPPDLPGARRFATLIASLLARVLQAGGGQAASDLQRLVNGRAAKEALQQAQAALDALHCSLPPPHLGDSITLDTNPTASEQWVLAVCALDELYFHLHYAAAAGPGGAAKLRLPSVADFLEAVAPPGGVQAAVSHLRADGQAEVAEALQSSLSSDTGGGCCDCELARILRARQCEGLWLFLCSGLSQSLQLKYKKKKAPTRMDEPLAPSILAKWRAVCRHWPARLFAFAVPSEEALAELTGRSPLVEIGAGTGYWASLLKSRGAQVTAYDTAPPSSGQWNSYHGQVPPFTTVARGGPEALRTSPPQASLFLCYPPPGSAMAKRCLDAFRGRTICHVGEWGGMTGDSVFEKQLTDTFHLVKVVPLPNWANTCYSLTVWQRRSGGSAADTGAPAAVLCCSACGGPVPLEGGVRSRLCHRLAYCCQECVDGHASERGRAMSVQLLPSVVHRRQHFAPLLAGGL